MTDSCFELGRAHHLNGQVVHGHARPGTAATSSKTAGSFGPIINDIKALVQDTVDSYSIGMTGRTKNEPLVSGYDLIVAELTEQNSDLSARVEKICQELKLPVDKFKQGVLAIFGADIAGSQPAPQKLPALPLPKVAPEEYHSRPISPKTGRRENIVEFLQRVWQPWMDAEVLTRVDLRNLDPSADKAVENWLIKRPLPENIKILKKSDVIDRNIMSNPGIVFQSSYLAQTVSQRLRRGSGPILGRR